jgi:opacity protein-like surface antigen
MKTLATTLALAALATAAHAQSYVSVKAGGTQVQDTDFDTAGGTVTTKTDTGFTGNVAIGTYLNDSARVEFEAGYNKSDLKSASVNGAGTTADGDVTAVTGMLNGYYDFAPNCLLRPYVGLGLGAANVKYNNTHVGGVAFTDDDDTVAAGQAMAGLKWQFSPHTAATVEYRYFRTADVSLDGAAGGSTDVKYSSHNLTAGLQYKF